MNWRTLMEGGKDLSIFALIIRSILLYIALIITTRMMGHRQVGILSGHNYLVAAGIVSLAAVRMVNPESSLTAGLVIVFIYAGVNIFLSFLDLKWSRTIDRKPSILMENGRLIQEKILDSHVTLDNFLGQLRLKGAYNLSELDTVVLEPNGKISVLKKPNFLPLSRKQMNLPQKFVALPTILIYDSRIEKNNLKQLGLDLEWVMAKLNEKGIANPEDVFLATLEPDGTIYVSAK